MKVIVGKVLLTIHENISLKSKYQCCVSESIFYEEDDESILEESTMQQNKEEIIIKKNELRNIESFSTVVN